MSRITRALVALALLASVIAAGDLVRQVVATSAERIGTPDPTDLQGFVVRDHALRVHAGLPIYREPDTTFCPLLYTPLYYYACAAMMGVLGTDPGVCRITSITLLGAAMALLVVFTGRVTRSIPASAAVLPVVLAGYAGCGFFYDAPRVDAASSLALIAAVLAGAVARRPRGGVGVGVLLAVAFLAKQSTPAFAVPFLAVLLLRGRGVAIAAATTYAGLVAIAVGAATAATDGWFWRICIAMPNDHAVPGDRLVALFGEDWLDRLRGFSVATVAVAATFGFRALRRRRAAPPGAPDAMHADTPGSPAGGGARPPDPADRTLGFLLLAFLCVLLMTTLAHAREGGTVKALIPACLLLGAVLPIGLWRMGRDLRGPARDGATIVALGLFLFLAVSGRFPREEAVVTPEIRSGWDALADVVRPLADRGEVWAAMSDYLRFPGQGMHAGELALNDYLKTGSNPMPPAVERAVADREFTAIVLQERLTRAGAEDRATRLTKLVREHYRVARRMQVIVGIRRKRALAAVYVPIEDVKRPANP